MTFSRFYTRLFSIPLVPALLLCLYAVPPVMAKTGPTHPPVTVSIPATVNDGTAFACSFSGDGLRGVTATFLGRSVSAGSARGSGEAVLLFPVPLDHKAGKHPLAWKATLAGGKTVSGETVVTVVKRNYPVQKLTVEPKYVTPDPALKERIDRERKEMGAALSSLSPERRWSLPMPRPVSGKVTSLYGLRRVFNGQIRNPHRGVDFRGAAGTPIKAVAAGTVVLTGDFYYSGKFVAVDHGLGVVSVSMHMSEIIARQGQEVSAGDVIGLVGSTGRSTGPHLHLGMSVLGQSVDALPLLAMTAEDKALYDQSGGTVGSKKAAAKKTPAPRTRPGNTGRLKNEATPRNAQ